MFLSAAKMPTVCAVLANAAELDWEIDHIDVKSAYLNAPLKETVYMCPPRGVLKSGQEGKCKRTQFPTIVSGKSPSTDSEHTPS